MWGFFDGNFYKDNTGWHKWSVAGSPFNCYKDDSLDYDSTPVTSPNSFNVKTTYSNYTCP
jgi:hypothetical protein